VEISFDSKDELGHLSKSFQNITNNLSNLVANIHETSEQVASESSQVSDSSLSLSARATEQASSIEKVEDGTRIAKILLRHLP
jgi:methyl-accepting chemotaxis protein